MFPIATQCDSLPTGARVVKPPQYAAALEADQILARANAEAEEIRRAAKEEYQRQKAKGYADGREKANGETSERMIDAVAETVAYFGAIEHRIVELVGRCIRKVLGGFDDQERITAVVRNALRWARNQSRVTLRVAPDQADALRKRVDELLANYPGIEVLDIGADEHLEPDECILETEIGSVDASVDTQVASIENSLRRAIGATVEAAGEPSESVNSAPPGGAPSDADFST